MRSKNLNNLKSLLRKAAGEKDLARRGVKIAAVIAEALRKIGEDPVLVGGAAVEFYTDGNYATKDIDMIAMGGPLLWKVMEELGFKRRGKDFINELLKIYIEFPSATLNPGEKSDQIDVESIPLKIISLEDLIVDRLAAYKFWKSGIDGLNALFLLELGKADMQRLRERAGAKEIQDALDWVLKIYEEVFRKKLSKSEASKKLEAWFQKK
ncbi:MAG: hypothetical protein HY877_00675 [Deltaproteobacteria bacterium]|nr:hypothetical protein [Deltaproteobacteria bacterium]